jgi:hypothetical protein
MRKRYLSYSRGFLSFKSFEVERYALFLAMTAPLSPILVVLFLLTGALLWQRSKQPQKDLPLPPGPKRWPLIGSLSQMPKVFEHETYRDWSRQYGDTSFL